jgi:ferric-dicitrate binding protein FerR (iron transport regulator)
MEEAQNIPDDKKMDQAYRIAYLVAGYIANTLTVAEQEELDEWVGASDENMELFAELTDEKNIEKALRERGLYDSDKAVEKLKRQVKESAGKRPTIPAAVYAIAATIILIIGITFLLPYLQKNEEQPVAIVKPDVLPGSEKAVLTLANGQKILLDSLHGNILEEQGFSVINDKGMIQYKGNAAAAEYHTLSTPNGGQYKIVLPDGTGVWLNAASSLTYPLAFTNAERVVELSGEGYFEVAKDAAKPFKVKLDNGTTVRVLGTHFNISDYKDQSSSRITLLEGSVRIEGAVNQPPTLLTPGQQGQINHSNPSSVTVTNDIDTDEVIAWKNGYFEFKDAPIEEIMNQVARWYDVSIKYEGKPTYHFNAGLSRDVPVSKLLYLLELTDRVHFTITNKTIIVKP